MANYNLFWEKWLLKYKSYKCLWDASSETTPQERLLAWKKLIEMAKTVNKNANAVYLRERLQKYVCKYKLKAKKVEAARANGFLYEPAAFYYKIFQSIHEELQVDVEVPEASETAEVEIYTNRPQAVKMEKNAEGRPWPKIIKRYVSLKCLWDEENEKTYTNKERLEAWKELLRLVKPFFPNADVEFLKNKFNALHATYQREVKRLAKSKLNGRECETKFKYFDLFTPIYQKDGCVVVNISEGEEADSDGQVEEIKSTLSNTLVLSEEKAIWFNVLKKYVSSKCLWDHRKSYTKIEKLKAWLSLLKMVKELHPDANLRFVKKRINAYRTNYRRELNKINKVKQQGIEYTTQLFYMDLLAPIYQSDCESSDEDDEKQTEETSSIASVDDELYTEFSEHAGKNRQLAKCTRDINLWRRFIKKYVTFDCLWDNRYVFKRSERSHAWQELLKLVQSSYPAAHLDYIRKRIYILRCLFEKEREKILAAKENGIELEPTVYFYHLMSPIYDVNGNTNVVYSSDEETNDSKNDLNVMEMETGVENPKYAAVRRELENLGFICGPFETEYLSNFQKGWLRVIKKYVSFKCLWDGKNRDDYTIIERDAAWNELLGAVKEIINSDADMQSMKHRINTFRTNYLRSFKKAKEEKENGLEPDITLWYFNAISPIYQEGFPIILGENEDLQPEATLNPQFTTYFPEDENVAAKSSNKPKVEVSHEGACYMLPMSNLVDTKILLENDFSLIDAEVVEEIAKDEPLEEFIDDDNLYLEMEQPQLTDDEEAYVSPDEHLYATKISPLPAQAETKPKGCLKRSITQTHSSDVDEHDESCHDEVAPKFGKFQTFETKIADHLDTMECEQYLLAEKLISDVCVYGRLGKLTIESGFKLKKD